MGKDTLFLTSAQKHYENEHSLFNILKIIQLPINLLILILILLVANPAIFKLFVIFPIKVNHFLIRRKTPVLYSTKTLSGL